MRILGVDPGLSGGLVLLSKKGEIKGKWVMPVVEDLLDIPELNAIVKQIKSDSEKYGVFAYLEKVSAMPLQGVSSVFKFGRVYGIMEALLVANEIPYTLVPPQRWSKVMHEGIEMIKKISKIKGKEKISTNTKARSRIAVSRLFPGEKFLATERSKVPHEGIVDASLLAEFGRRQKYTQK